MFDYCMEDYYRLAKDCIHVLLIAHSKLSYHLHGIVYVVILTKHNGTRSLVKAI